MNDDQQQPLYLDDAARIELYARYQTERVACPACQAKRLHTPEEWRNHPAAGQVLRVELTTKRRV